MAKRNRGVTQTVIDRRIKEGCGQGRGANYKPWLTIQTTISNATCKRILGWKTGRRHELFNQNQIRYFYILEWSKAVVDIREHYPLLPLEETLEIAEKLGFRHPTDTKTNEPIVITTDFFITVPQSIGVSDQARTVKLPKELENKRAIELLEIERQYWQNKNISWGIVTEHEIPLVLAKNIDWLHDRFYADNLSLSERELFQAKQLLTQWVTQKDVPLTEITVDCDDQLGLEPGKSLSVIRHLLATRQLLADMNQPLEPRKKLVLLPAQSVET